MDKRTVRLVKRRRLLLLETRRPALAFKMAEQKRKAVLNSAAKPKESRWLGAGHREVGMVK